MSEDFGNNLELGGDAIIGNLNGSPGFKVDGIPEPGVPINSTPAYNEGPGLGTVLGVGALGGLAVAGLGMAMRGQNPPPYQPEYYSETKYPHTNPQQNIGNPYQG